MLPIFAMAGAPHVCPVGEVGRFSVIPVDRLRIDPTFQRAISGASEKNIRKICAGFDWRRFTPVIVAPAGEYFSVIDGQHRATAARSIGIEAVPCYIQTCTPEEAAGAFAAVNGDVTPVSAVDVWFALLAARDPAALADKRVLDAADVIVCRKKRDFAAGETKAINVIRRMIAKRGPELAITTLQCVTQTGDGHPGLLYGAVLNGIADAIQSKALLLSNHEALFRLFDRIKLPELVALAKTEKFKGTTTPLQCIITRRINVFMREIAA